MITIYIISVLISCLIGAFFLIYGIDSREPYPFFMIKAFSEPSVRFIIYLLLYIVSTYEGTSNIFAIISMLTITTLHLDIINLAGDCIFCEQESIGKNGSTTSDVVGRTE
jgi:hypothetical protein